LRSLSPGLYERRAMVVEHEHCLPVRLIALVLPEQQAEALRRQNQRQARDKGRTFSQEALSSGRLRLAGEDFATGWLVNNDTAVGRPAGLAVGPDNALYISDDLAGIIYRVT